MITTNQQTSIQSLEEVIEKFQRIFINCTDNHKPIPLDMLNPYFTMKDRRERLYEQQREERIKRAVLSKNYKPLMAAIS